MNNVTKDERTYRIDEDMNFGHVKTIDTLHIENPLFLLIEENNFYKYKKFKCPNL